MATPEETPTAEVAAPTAGKHAAIVHNADNTLSGPNPLAHLEDRTVDDWPDPLRPEAFHGVLGEFVAEMKDKTEADPAAILVGSLVMFGTYVGYEPFSSTGGTGNSRVRANENLLVVGDSGLGRKGTAAAEVTGLFLRVDPEWVRSCVRSGLSSGEGLAYAVRDPKIESRPAKNGPEMDRADENGMVQEMVDEGVTDKRLLAREGEFARVIAASGRRGSTLGADLRHAWDSTPFGTMTKSAPVKATDPHISVHADITPEELHSRVEGIDLLNGFLNRFLLILVRRPKIIEEPVEIAEPVLDAFADRIRQAGRGASQFGRMIDTPDAHSLWIETRYRIDEMLQSTDNPLRSMLARAEAHIRRLAMIYALADGTNVVSIEHMRAALAVWDYAEASCAHIFGGKLGDPIAAKIEGMLAERPEGLTQTEVSNAFSRHKSAEELGRAMRLLEDRGKVVQSVEDGGGRPTTRWRHRENCEIGESSEVSTHTPAPSSPISPISHFAPDDSGAIVRNAQIVTTEVDDQDGDDADPEVHPPRDQSGTTIKAAWDEALEQVNTAYMGLPDPDAVEVDTAELAELEAQATRAAEEGNTAEAMELIARWRDGQLQRFRQLTDQDEVIA